MVHITSGQVTLGKTASILGISQGIAWFAMSLLCIIEFNIETLPEAHESYISEFNSRVYYLYLYKNATLPAGTIVTPLTFTIFMWIYIVLNTVWVVTSLFQLNILKKRSINTPIVIKDWALVTWAISLVDLILVILLGADYDQHRPSALYTEYDWINTVIPVLVIVARGFALWFVNVIIAWRMLKNAEFLRRDGHYEGTFGGILPFYRATGHIPRANVSSEPSLYSQQIRNINSEKNLWNVNLRTAMDVRTPPITPRNQQEFFASNRSSPVSPGPRTPTGRNRNSYGRY